MTKSAKTVFIFGIYLILEGIFLILAPSRFLSYIGLPDAESIWRVIVGFVVFVLGYYYTRNARENLEPFFVFTVHIRILQFFFFFYIYMLEAGTITLLLFSLIELLAGLWTWRAITLMRREPGE